ISSSTMARVESAPKNMVIGWARYTDESRRWWYGTCEIKESREGAVCRPRRVTPLRAALRSFSNRMSNRPLRASLEPVHEVAKDDVALRLVEDLVIETVVELERHVLRRRLLGKQFRPRNRSSLVVTAVHDQDRKIDLSQSGSHLLSGSDGFGTRARLDPAVIIQRVAVVVGNHLRVAADHC